MDMNQNWTDNSSRQMIKQNRGIDTMSTGSLSNYRLETSTRIPSNQSRKDASMSIPTGSEQLSESNNNQDRYILWVDGIGSYLVLMGENVTIGGPHQLPNSVDIPLLSNLSRKHASIIRSSSSNYYLEAHSKVSVSGREVFENTYLNSGSEIQLGNSVQLAFHIPNALSSSAVLSFQSGHRPDQNVDAVILMNDSCLLGPGQENHITCKDWNETVILFKQGNELYCQSRADLFMNDQLIDHQIEIPAGAVISGMDFRFRLEKI